MSHHDTAQPPKAGDGRSLSRRRFLQGGLAAAATASLALPLGSSEAATALPNLREAPPKPVRGKGPNILIILCDEMRFPPDYESGKTRQFRFHDVFVIFLIYIDGRYPFPFSQWPRAAIQRHVE